MGGNFKIRALESDEDYFNKGDIIEFRNGRCMWDNGVESCFYESFKQFIERNRMFWKDCFELIEEEGENKMEDLRELIKPCYLLVLENDVKVKTVETQKGIVGQYQYGGWDELNTMINEVEKIYGFSTHGANIGEFSEECRPLIYERISPTQLKLEELEKKQREIADEMEKLRKEL